MIAHRPTPTHTPTVPLRMRGPQKRVSNGLLNATRSALRLNIASGVSAIAKAQYDVAKKRFDELAREHASCDQRHRAAQKKYLDSVPQAIACARGNAPVESVVEALVAVNEMVRASTELAHKANEMHEMSEKAATKAEVWCKAARVVCQLQGTTLD